MKSLKEHISHVKDLHSFNEYIDEQFNPEWDYVVEMATIGNPVLDKKERLIMIHGTNSGDRQRPHVHICLNDDVRPFKKFNFEIALDEILCYDELNLIRMTDKKNNINKKKRSLCSWNGYHKLKDEFEDWLYQKSNKRGDFIDNLDALICFYNLESIGMKNSNPLLDYIKDHGMKILEKHKKYFSEEDIEKYKECFE